jgi:hypothetical protein
MDCTLCKKLIKEYNPSLNHLVLGNDHAVDICAECIDKFTKWQGRIIANLFPTKAMKKRFGKN